MHRAKPHARSTVVAAILFAAFVVQAIGAVAEARPVTVAAAGDIACPRHPCDPQRRTARIIRHMHPRAVLPLGDNQYPAGLAVELPSFLRPDLG